MDYSLIVRDQYGTETTFASASYIDNVFSMNLAVPVPKKPWWYHVKDAITPILLAMIVFKPYRQ
jgi:hypothetical protein